MGYENILGIWALASEIRHLNPHKRTHGAPIAKPAQPRQHGPQRKKNRGGKRHNTKRSR